MIKRLEITVPELWDVPFAVLAIRDILEAGYRPSDEGVFIGNNKTIQIQNNGGESKTAIIYRTCKKTSGLDAETCDRFDGDNLKDAIVRSNLDVFSPSLMDCNEAYLKGFKERMTYRLNIATSIVKRVVGSESQSFFFGLSRSSNFNTKRFEFNIVDIRANDRILRLTIKLEDNSEYIKYLGEKGSSGGQDLYDFKVKVFADFEKLMIHEVKVFTVAPTNEWF